MDGHLYELGKYILHLAFNITIILKINSLTSYIITVILLYISYIDGRKKFPINHGPCSADSLLEDACRVVRSYMERDPEELKFTIVALCKTPVEEDY